MLRVVPGPQSTPHLFPAQGIVTSDRPNFDAARFFSHGAFPRNLGPRAKTHSHRPADGHGLEERQALPVRSRAAESESSRRRKRGDEVEGCEAAAATEKSYSTFFHSRSCPSRRSTNPVTLPAASRSKILRTRSWPLTKNTSRTSVSRGAAARPSRCPTRWSPSRRIE